MSEYPMHDKLAAIQDESQAIGDFLSEFLPSKGYVVAHIPPQFHSTLVPIDSSVEALLAEYFGIDLRVLEYEKRKMLASLPK